MGEKVKFSVATRDGVVEKTGQILNIKNSNENWSVYELENGNKLKIKQIVTKVVMLDDEKDLFGKPVFRLQAQPVIVVE